MEPEFVEWGYGGMGSNKSNTNSSMGSAWKVVQNGSNASAFGNDDDDSSGMGWVKKRRAEREKAKREAEKMEHGGADVEVPQPAIAEEEQEETPRLPKEDNVPHLPIDAPPVAPAEQSHEEQAYITTAINLPPQRPHKREAPFNHRIQIPQPESPTRDESSFGVGVFDMEAPEPAPESPEASTGSTSEDEDSSSDADDEDESDLYSEVCIPPLSVRVSLDNFGHFRRRMRVARRPWAQVSRRLAGIRIHLSRRPPICRTPF